MSGKLLFELLRQASVASDDLTRLATDFVRDRLAIGTRGWTCHPLGFFVSKLSIGDGMELRLHVWPSDWALPTEQMDADLHDHIFALSSLVLSGVISNETFEMVIDDSGGFRTIDVAYSGNTSGGSSLGSTLFRLDQRTTAIHRPGEIYHVAAGVVHRGGAVRLLR
jgi:hypothetical protein